MKCRKCNEDKMFHGWTETEKTAHESKELMYYWNISPWNKPVFICNECK